MRRDFTVSVQKFRPVVDTQGYYNIGHKVVLKTLERYISSVRPVVSVPSSSPSSYVRPSVRPVVRPVVVARRLSVRHVVSRRRRRLVCSHTSESKAIE